MTADYGPQTEQITALLERVRTLTDDETGRLHVARDAALYAALYVARDAARDAARAAARDAAWDAAWDAARVAARDAAWAAAWVAAWVAVWAAAWVAARDAARDAAWALLVRDLISDEGFTQSHYDLLTGPWRRVIGPVHPDDEDLREVQS